MLAYTSDRIFNSVLPRVAGVRTPMWAVRRSDTAADLQFGERFLNHLYLTETNRSIEIVAIVNVCRGSRPKWFNNCSF